MSGIINPIGPEPPMVYWIRRVALILIVVVVLVALWWLVGAVRGGDSSASETPESPTSSTGASTDPSASPTATSTSTTITNCAASDIKVEATTDASTYPVGSTPKLTLVITNTGDVPCKRNVGPKANELEITSGGFHVWSSDDCNANTDSSVKTLKPDKPVQASITWNGRLSQKGCPNPDGDEAKAGRYDLVGRNGSVSSEATPFALTSKTS